MKKSITITALLLQATFISVMLLGVSSCTNNQPEDTKDVAEEHNDAKYNKAADEKDAQFLVNAAEINLTEISLGKLAHEKGTSRHVRDLGKMMHEHHQASLNDLTALAKSKMVTIPTTITDNGNQAYNNLNDKSGADFDKAYSDMMVAGHKDAVAIFETASTDRADDDIKAWAAATLPELRKHLDQSITCQKLCEKM